jgi:hypothetical protein
MRDLQPQGQSSKGIEDLENQLCWDPKSIWTGPPEELPGPDEHPFFKALHQSLNSKNEKSGDISAVDSLVSTYQTLYLNPSVYPFIPPPSICLERQSAGPQTHSGEYTILWNQPVGIDDVSSTTPTPSTASMTRSGSPAIKECKARCTKMYVRTFRCSSTNRRQTVHGQIWQGGADEPGNLGRWRRDQWIADG